MKKTLILAVVLAATVNGDAIAGGQDGTIGVGAEFGLNGETGGVSMNYDGGKFHVGGFLGFSDGGGNDDTNFTLGARFFYHVHKTAMSDFGVGGGFGFFSEDREEPDDRQSRMYLEPSFQIRLFLASNVALSFTAGITLALVDADGVSLGGPAAAIPGAGAISVINGTAGIHYYFF